MNSNYFKTQQEVMRYVLDGGTVVFRNGGPIKFVDGTLNHTVYYSFADPEYWQPYIEPKPKLEKNQFMQQSDDGQNWISLDDSKAILRVPTMKFIRFYLYEDGHLEVSCAKLNPWYIEHEKAKTKVWRWELIGVGICDIKCIHQPEYFYTEEDATRLYPGYTKVEGSEREI